MFEIALATIDNMGHHSGRLFYVNESYVELKEEALEAFYRTDPRIFDPRHVAR